VGEENIFICGMTADGVSEMRAHGYRPWDFYHANPELKRAVDMIASGYFNADDPSRYKAVFDTLLTHGDHYFLMADYQSYVSVQNAVGEAYQHQDDWMRKAIINVANMGTFSSDRSIHDYARTIWNIKPMD
jgi:starch phosphorylase